jgi:DNA-binding FadR family transcriptional regulator
MAEIRIQRLSEQVTVEIARRIVSGELEAGAFAPSEHEIGDEFGVSKTVAREVTAALVAKGLVRVQHGRRPEVRPSDDWDMFDPLILEVHDPEVAQRLVSDMNELRDLLEPEIAARAALTATESQRLVLCDLVDQMEKYSGELAGRLELDVAFHLQLARATQNALFLHIVESVQVLLRSSISRRADFVLREKDEHPDYHRLVCEAIQSRDSEGARAAMQEHMTMANRIWAGSPRSWAG